jgi:peroxin-14
VLPFGSRALSSRELSLFRPLLASYLDIQKRLVIDDLDEEEAWGRWKAFVGRW